MFSRQIRKLISFYLLLQFPIVYCDANRRTASIPMKVKITGHCFDICFHFFLFFRLLLLLFFDVVMIVLSCGRWMVMMSAHELCVCASQSLSLSGSHYTYFQSVVCLFLSEFQLFYQSKSSCRMCPCLCSQASHSC